MGNINNIGPAIVMVLLLGAPSARGAKSGAETTRFSLTITDERIENRIAGHAPSTVEVAFRNEVTLYGRLAVSPDDSTITVVAYNDSIRFERLAPMPFESFMSRDTMYHSTKAGPKVSDTGRVALYDSMLACIFEGPSLEISLGRPARIPGGEGRDRLFRAEIEDRKPDCPSGEYGMIDPPVSLGAFFASPWHVVGRDGIRWRSIVKLPGYSSLRFRPEIAVSWRTVRARGELAAVVTADTIITDVRLKMPNGETFVIIEDKIHVGGTFFLVEGKVIPAKAELRIEEQIKLLRPDISNLVGTKSCSYVLRFRTLEP
jgi:hypothetical protein